MKIEAKLAINNMRKNKKRTLYTTISLILCTMLILTAIILVSSIRNGVSDNFETEYNDYHIVLHNLSPERFNAIKNKSYIDKIYIQKNENEPLEKVDASYNSQENITVYLKYDNIRNVCAYSNDILGDLELSEKETKEISKLCQFNNKILTVNGLIDVTPDINNKGLPNCKMRINYSYVIDLMIIMVILIFSAIFIMILYNAFLITINERKKEYAILNSVGGTEGQILKMVYIEAILMGIVGITIGGFLSTIISQFILNNLNNILESAGYYFRLKVEIQYIVFAIIIIAINIYLSVLIPSIKASSTSVIQGIRSNKQIKYKHNRKNSILEKILPVEGKVAIKNAKRNKSKYRVITLLLVVSITSFIAMSTYLKYEKETADIVTEYDVDAQISLMTEDIFQNMNMTEDISYTNILQNYEKQYNKKLEIIEYNIIHNNTFMVFPQDAVMPWYYTLEHTDNTKSIAITIVALDNKTYQKYIEELDGNYGDIIIYNNVAKVDNTTKKKKGIEYVPVFREDSNIRIALIKDNILEDGNWDYEIIEDKILNKNYILTDTLLSGFNEIKSQQNNIVTMFMNINTFNELDKYIENTYGKLPSYPGEENTRNFWYNNIEGMNIKIKCDNILEFKNYMDNVLLNNTTRISSIEYFSLENQENLIYIEIVELILKVVMVAIVSIGIISTINIMNASLIERREDFNILYRMGATKRNVKKMLIYEGIYMYVKAVIISAILAIPIIYGIINEFGNVIILNKLLIPFAEIAVFIAILFVITLIITLLSTKTIKEE